MLRTAKSSTLDFLSPPACAHCDLPTRRLHQDSLPHLCESCAGSVAPAVANPCPRCAAPRGPFLIAPEACAYCQADRFAFSGVVSLGVYNDKLRHACLRAKADPGNSLAAALGSLLVDRHVDQLEGWKIDAVVPVPLHWFFTILPGNEAPLALAEAIAARLRRPVARDILSKRRWTRSQGQLPPTERRANLRDAFRASRRCRGLRLLLVDDVLTTGTTAHRCARALLSAGAESVHVAVVARGLGKPRVQPPAAKTQNAEKDSPDPEALTSTVGSH